MKKLLLISFTLLMTVAVIAQERLSGSYWGPMLHDFNKPGVSFVNTFGINKYIAVGPSIDFTSYESKLLVPVYADIHIKYPTTSFVPFIFGQAGYPIYKKEAVAVTPGYSEDIKGKIFYGGGAGVSYKLSKKIGVFASYTQRFYRFKFNNDNADINGRPLKDYLDNSASVGVITAGIIF